MYTNTKVAKSIRLALMFGASATAMTGIAAAQEAEEAEEQATSERVERIQVTGSRLARTDMEESLPLTVIDRDAIDMSGEISVSDVIRNTTFNTSGSFRPQSGNAAGATATVSLRGLGSDRTLVLVDGRRLPKSPSTGSSQDLNIVPLAAVERIEILSTGASAIYGSDAVGGVINIITRTDFNGAQFRYGQSEISLPANGGDREEGSAVFGASTDSTRVLGGVSWNARDIIYHRDYSWVEPGGSAYGNNWLNYDAVNDAPAGGHNSIPAGAAACEATENYLFSNGACNYNFNATNANEAQTGNRGLFVKVDHEFNEDWAVMVSSSYSKSKYFGRYAPSLNDPFSVMNADSINNPTNPISPNFQQSAVDGDGENYTGNRDLAYRHRFASLGNRDTYVDTHATDVMVAFEGRVGEVDLDFGLRRSTSKAYETGYNYLLRSAAADAVNITQDEIDESLALNPDFVYYDLGDPLGSRYAGNDAQMENYQVLLNGMNVTTARVGRFETREWFGSAVFDIMEFGAGTIQAVVGAEYREEDYSDQYDSLSEAGQVGGSSGNSAGGGRDVTAFYFETMVPLTLDLELTVAGRFDDYSDYGSDFSPQVSFRWQPMQELVVRGSWGQGFRAPTLDQITMQPSSGNPAMQDQATCYMLTGDIDCDVQVRQITQANSELESEKSDQFGVGVAYQPLDWLNLTFDYWDISITNQISFFGIDTLLAREAAGDPIPPGVFIERDTSTDYSAFVDAGEPVNPIRMVYAGFANDGTYDISGMDFNARTNFDFGQWGSLTQNLQISYTTDISIDGGRNLVKDPGRPQHRTSLSNTWTLGDYSATWNMNVVGNQYNAVASSGDGVERTGNIGSWTTHDLQLNYNTPWNGVFTVGAQNLFEKVPQLGTSTAARGTRDYNFNLYHAYGRITYFRYTQSF